MIMLTRLSGTQFVLNSDLVERIDATPDTVVTLTDGTKYVVSESLTEVVDRVRTFRSEIVALSSQLSVEQFLSRSSAPSQETPAHLASVTSLPAGSPAHDPDGQEL